MEAPGVTAFALWFGDFLQRAGVGAAPLAFAPLLMIARPDFQDDPLPMRAGWWAALSATALAAAFAVAAAIGLRLTLSLEAGAAFVAATALFLLFSPAALARAVGRLSDSLLTAAGWLALIMAAAMLANVIMRYVFAIGFGWARETVIYAFAACFLVGSAGALRNDGHVRVDIFRERMSGRGRAIVDIAGTYLFLIPMMILAISVYAPQLANAWGGASGRLETSRETDGLPLLFLFKTLVPLFAGTLILQGWANAVKAAAVIAGDPIIEDDAPRAHPAA